MQSFLLTEIEAVYCMLNPNDKSSIRTIEDIGMTYMGTHNFMGKPAVYYVSTAPGGCCPLRPRRTADKTFPAQYSVDNGEKKFEASLTIS